MFLKKRELTQLSLDVRKIIDGKSIDIRDYREGVWCTLKNDIHTLATLKSEQAEFISNIKTELTHMDWLVSTLLKMAKLDAGAITFFKERITTNALYVFRRTGSSLLLPLDGISSLLLSLRATFYFGISNNHLLLLKYENARISNSLRVLNAY